MTSSIKGFLSSNQPVKVKVVNVDGTTATEHTYMPNMVNEHIVSASLSGGQCVEIMELTEVYQEPVAEAPKPNPGPAVAPTTGG